MYFEGTNPEKKLETDIKYDVTNQQTDVTIDIYNMHPWLRKVCITNHVINNDEMRLDLKFGENCIGYDQYRVQVRKTF